MYESIVNTYNRLLQSLNINTYRYLYHFFDLKKNRLTGLIGPRGTGKTTLLLQIIKNNLDKKDAIYVSLDNIMFSEISIFRFVEDLYEVENIKYFFFDEVHKYKNWIQEIKNIYDSFPEIKIIFSGSSSIDLIKVTYDLSRRAIMYNLHGLSFREYLNFITNNNLKEHTLKNLIDNHLEISYELSKIPKIKKYFLDYLANGYYPFIFEGKETFNEKLFRIIDKIIFEDIPNYYKLKTSNLYIFKKILYFIASIPPGDISINNLSNHLKIDFKTTEYFLNILSETGLIQKLFIDKKGSKLVRTPEKIYLNNTSLYNSINNEIGIPFEIGTIREIFFINSCVNGNYKIFYSKEIGDFKIENNYFEIGGKSKKSNQLKKDYENSYIVKDSILNGSKKEIPLYLFGFLY